MFRLYIVCAFLALGSFGYAQYKGWSLFGSDAEEFQRRRAEQVSSRTSGGTSRGGSSGHK
jgi:hypothetical protein